jgi:hypothetical protein
MSSFIIKTTIDMTLIIAYFKIVEGTFNTPLFMKLMKELKVTIFSKYLVPLNKMVIGKPATPQDAGNTGYVNPQDLGNFIGQAK